MSDIPLKIEESQVWCSMVKWPNAQYEGKDHNGTAIVIGEAQLTFDIRFRVGGGVGLDLREYSKALQDLETKMKTVLKTAIEAEVAR